MSKQLFIPQQFVKMTTDPATYNVTVDLEDTGTVSDGYHTFNELYRYRMLLQAAWFNTVAHGKKNQTKIVKSYRHADGELCFGKENYFVVVAELPTGQVSNHYKGEYWDLFDVPAVDRAPEWDGHTPAQAADRIEQYIKGNY